MRKFFFFALAAGAACAADPAGVVVWKSAELKGYEQKLAPKIDAHKVATTNLGTFGNHLAMIAHREGTGEAELHERQADFFVVESGEATLVVGGKIVNGRSTGPGEVRGASISGGAKHAIAPGDVVHIPANTPHQLLLDSGKQFTYLTIKVDVK
jgi:mannose-6-phosphate isomerase-like protein (cupin superfamily)